MAFKSDLPTLSGNRIHAIDALRGAAILLMVFSHGLSWTYTGTSHDLFAFFGRLSVGDVATPSFYLVAGVSLYYSLLKRERESPGYQDVWKGYAFRLSRLFIMGMLLTLSWGVLQAQAITLFFLVTLGLFMPFHLHDTNKTRTFAALVAVAALGLHLVVSGIATPSPYFRVVMQGQFPPFAILAISATGFGIAPSLRSLNFARKCLLLGLALAGAALVMGTMGLPIQRHGASLPFIVLGIGLSLAALSLLRPVSTGGFVFRSVAAVGRNSLYFFLLHYLVFYVPLYMLGFMDSMGRVTALVFSSLMAVTIAGLGKALEHRHLSVYSIVDSWIEAVIGNTLLQHNRVRPASTPPPASLTAGAIRLKTM